MSSSPEQSGAATPLNATTPLNSTPLTVSRGISEASIVSTVSVPCYPSGGESPPNTYQGNTLSPPQVMNVLGTSSSSTPNSPHLPRPSSGTGFKGMRRKFGRKGPTQTSPSPQTVQEQDSLDAQDNQANKALFIRMLKSWQLQPKKMKHFRRGKRRADKQYHSDDGYTSDPGVLREEEDDETDNDPDEILRRRLGNDLEERKQEKMSELERKADKIRRSLEEDDTSLQYNNDDDLESISTTDKPQHKPMFWLHRSNKSKSFHDNQRQKLEKIESQLKELKEGGGLDSRGARIRGRIEGGLRGMSQGFKGLGRLTHAGIKRRRKRSGRGQEPGDMDVIDDEEDEDEDGQGAEVIITEETSPEQDDLVSLKVDTEALRLAAEEALEQNKKWKEEMMEQQERFGTSLTVFMDKLDQERERGDRLEAQLNDITELHQHAVDNLRTQLSQIEHTTTNRCQDFEDAIDEFQAKFNNLDAHMHVLMDTGTGEIPKVNLTLRSIAASLLSFLLLIFAFVLKLKTIVMEKPLLMVPILVLLTAVLIYYVFA